MSLSSASGIDTIVCLYCRALIAFSGLPAKRYSDHLRHEHNILVPDELQFSISRTLKKTFSKKAGLSRIKLQSFSEASRLDDPMNVLEFNDNVNQDYNGNSAIVVEKDEDVYQDEQRIPINSINDEDQNLIENGQDQNLNNCEMQESVKEGTVDYKSSKNECRNKEKVLLPKILPKLKLPECYVKIEKVQISKFGMKPKSSHRKKKLEPEEVPWYEFKLYRCLLCGVEVFLGSVDRHLSVIHTSDVANYLTKFPQEANSLSVPMWSCGICGEKTSHMHRTITHHLDMSHDHMDINHYYFVHVLGIKKEKEEANQIKVDPDETGGHNLEVNHSVTGQASRNLRGPSLIINLSHWDTLGAGRQLSALGRLPHGLVHQSMIQVPLKLPWYEGSWHRCHICQEIFTFGYFVKTHIKRVHGITQGKYFAQNPGAKFKLADWTCQICSKKIRWTNDSIYRHLHYGHRMSKTEYQQRYLEEDSVVGNVTDETLTGEENDEIELPGVPVIGDASWVVNTKVLNPFHSPLPRHVKNNELDIKKNTQLETVKTNELEKKDTQLESQLQLKDTDLTRIL